MATSRSVFPAGLLRNMRNVIGQKYKEHPPQYSVQMDVTSSTMAKETIGRITPLRSWPQSEELQDITLDDLAAGPSTELVNAVYKMGIIVSQEMLEDMQYPEVLKMTALLGRSGRETIEVNGAQVYVNAFNPASAGADGVSLCNALHPLYHGSQTGNTISNVAATASALTYTSFWDLVDQAAGWTDDAGNHINLTHGKMVLVVPQALERVAAELLHNKHVPGTADNDINVLKETGRMWTYHVNNYTSDTTAWFLYFPDVEDGVIFQWRIKPQFNKDATFSQGHRFEGRMRFVAGFADWRCVIGNQGA